MKALHSVQDVAFQKQPGQSLHPGRNGRWLQVLSHLSPRYGGIANSVPLLAAATEAAGLQTCPVVAFCHREELKDIQEQERAAAAEIFSPNRTRWILDLSLTRRLKDTILNADGLHIHGVWETHCMVAARTAVSCRRPYMISAHGMLEPWALRQKRLKKALYAALIEIRGMRRAACLRALSTDEVDDYRRVGLTNPVAIVPGGTDAQPGASPDLFRSAYPQISGKRVVLFLGRVDPKKGLHLLLKAWARSACRKDEMHLVIAGPDSGNTRPVLERLTDELGLQSSVTFTGALSGDLKWSALAAASLFVLPSFSEGFSIAVLEALAFGVPVIVTTPCHIPEVAIHSCGWVTEPAVRPLETALTEYMELSSRDADEIGKRGQNLFRTRFHSSVVGKQMAQVYQWLQGGSKPSDLEII